MITRIGNGLKSYKLLSTDLTSDGVTTNQQINKDLRNGDEVLCMDTSVLYNYDEEHKKLVEFIPFNQSK